MRPNEYFRYWLHSHCPDCKVYQCVGDIPPNVDCARLPSKRASSCKILTQSKLRLLEAQAVDQKCLEDLCNFVGLEYLALEYPLMARDLTPLTALNELRVLKINSPRNVSDFTPLLALQKLERLFIKNAKHIVDIEWLRPMKGQLRVLGIEGGMYTPQPILTLRPLEGFALEALFLANTRLVEKSFASLQAMSSLRYLSTARNVPRAEFEALHIALPNSGL